MCFYFNNIIYLLFLLLWRFIRATQTPRDRKPGTRESRPQPATRVNVTRARQMTDEPSLAHKVRPPVGYKAPRSEPKSVSSQILGYLIYTFERKHKAFRIPLPGGQPTAKLKKTSRAREDPGDHGIEILPYSELEPIDLSPVRRTGQPRILLHAKNPRIWCYTSALFIGAEQVISPYWDERKRRVVERACQTIRPIRIHHGVQAEPESSGSEWEPSPHRQPAASSRDTRDAETQYEPATRNAATQSELSVDTPATTQPLSIRVFIPVVRVEAIL